MNNEELLERLSMILSILNNVEVKGVQNLRNLAGAIAAIDEIGQKIAQEASEAPPSQDGKGAG